MKTFPDLYDYVLPNVRGCGPEMATITLRNALIEMLERTRVWSVTQSTSLVTVASQGSYVLTDVPVGARVVQITDAWLDGVPLDLATPEALRQSYGKWQSEEGQPQCFTSDENGNLILVPMPETAGEAITAAAVITYTPTVIEFEDWMFNRFYLALADGAKAELFAMLGKPWSSAPLATYHRNKFEDAVGTAGATKDKGYTRAMLRSTPQFR